jgi:hypothetical protein
MSAITATIPVNTTVGIGAAIQQASINLFVLLLATTICFG